MSGDVPTTGTTEDALADQFGFVCIELDAGEGVVGDPFAGTAKVVARMTYEPCLIDYYGVKHPEMRLDGPADAGGAVFQAWKERLCTEEVADRVDCTVESFEQTLNEGDMLYNLAVTYMVADPGALAGRRLLWGPAPLPAYAECEAGLKPAAKLTALIDVVGVSAENIPLWSLQSFGPTPRGLVGADGGGCLQVTVAPTP